MATVSVGVAVGDWRPVATVRVGDCAGEGVGDTVPPAGAQNGPTLNVARCVPAIELKGDCDVTLDGDAACDA